MATDAAHAVTKTINVGLQPADLLLSRDGKRLFAANANAETVSVISVESDSVVETIPTSPAPGRLAASSPERAGPIAGRTNALCHSRRRQRGRSGRAGCTARAAMRPQTGIAGLIPTAWFPLGVTLGADGKTLYVANSKGIGSLGAIVNRPRATSGAATPEAGPGGTVEGGNFVGHSVYAVMGSLGIMETPDKKTLAQYTAQVARNNHFDRMDAALKQKPDPFWSRFKHVVLVIKENRTYDQVFGDIAVPCRAYRRRPETGDVRREDHAQSARPGPRVRPVRQPLLLGGHQRGRAPLAQRGVRQTTMPSAP